MKDIEKQGQMEDKQLKDRQTRMKSGVIRCLRGGPPGHHNQSETKDREKQMDSVEEGYLDR